MAVFISSCEKETRDVAASLAKACGPDETFLLRGDLGAGKSFFARSFIQTLAGRTIEVPSPTFTLVQMYETAKAPIWHFDLYRLQDPSEIFEIGWEEAQNGGICLVEWPERLGPYAPLKARIIDIVLTGKTHTSREIRVDEPKT